MEELGKCVQSNVTYWPLTQTHQLFVVWTGGTEETGNVGWEPEEERMGVMNIICAQFQPPENWRAVTADAALSTALAVWWLPT